jgi:hypothetical protein
MIGQEEVDQRHVECKMVRIVSIDSDTQITTTVGCIDWTGDTFRFPLHEGGHVIEANQFSDEDGVNAAGILVALEEVFAFDDHLNSVPSIHIRCRMTASFRATATLALRSPLRFASRMPQALSADHFATRVSSTLAAS